MWHLVLTCMIGCAYPQGDPRSTHDFNTLQWVEQQDCIDFTGNLLKEAAKHYPKTMWGAKCVYVPQPTTPPREASPS